MSLLEAAILAAFSLYSIFLLALALEYFTDKRGRKTLLGRKSISMAKTEKRLKSLGAPGKRARSKKELPGVEPGDLQAAEPQKDDEAPDAWKTEEFE